MRWYWTRIVVGALAIFVVGFAILSAVRAARSQVEHVVRTSSDVSLPVPFIPFSFNGAEVGKFRRLVLHRSDPRHLSGIDLSVRVSDAAALARLAEDCRLTVDDPKRLTSNTTFRCVEPDETLQPFGEVEVQTRDADGDWSEAFTVPLLLPRAVVADLEGSQVTAGIAGAEIDEIQQLADSIRSVSQRLAGASNPERVELTRQLARLRMELREVERAVAEVARTRAHAALAEAPAVRIEVHQSAHPAVPPAPKG